MLCFNSKCGMNNSADMNDLYRDPMFNPMAQYEQAYCYYRYLCMQMDYKIKCKEYEKMCNSSSYIFFYYISLSYLIFLLIIYH